MLLASQQSVESAVQEMMGKLNLTPRVAPADAHPGGQGGGARGDGGFHLNQDTLQQLLRQMLLEGLQP